MNFGRRREMGVMPRSFKARSAHHRLGQPKAPTTGDVRGDDPPATDLAKRDQSLPRRSAVPVPCQMSAANRPVRLRSLHASRIMRHMDWSRPLLQNLTPGTTQGASSVGDLERRIVPHERYHGLILGLCQRADSPCSGCSARRLAPDRRGRAPRVGRAGRRQTSAAGLRSSQAVERRILHIRHSTQVLQQGTSGQRTKSCHPFLGSSLRRRRPSANGR